MCVSPKEVPESGWLVFSRPLVFVVVVVAFELGEVNVVDHAVADSKLNQCQAAEDVLVGHLNTVRSLGSYLFHRALDVDSAARL